MLFPPVVQATEIHQAIPQAIAALENLDCSTGLEAAGKIFREGIKENFERESDSFGSIWPPRKDDLPHPLLRLTYAMYNAASEEGAAGQITNIGQQSAEFGIDLGVVPYARRQNFGDALANLPAREYFYAMDEVEEAMGEVIAADVAQQIGAT